MKALQVGALACLALAGALGPLSCDGGDEAPAAGGGGAAGKGGAAGRAGAKAKAGQAGAYAPLPPLPSQDGFTIAEPYPLDYDCGPGCKKVFDVSYKPAANGPMRVDANGAVDGGMGPTPGIFFSDGREGSPTYVVGHLDDSMLLGVPSLTPKYVIGLMQRYPLPADPTQQETLYVWDRATQKVVHIHPMPGFPQLPPPEPPLVPDYLAAAANDTYALYNLGTRLLRVTLATGEIKHIGTVECFHAQLLDGKYICSDDHLGPFRAIDVETGEVEVFAPSSALQTEGSCSLQGDQCAWVDYRDPPGNTSVHYNRVGGDIYLFDRVHKVLRRVTFDSPSTPLRKLQVGLEGNLVTWLEAGDIQLAASDPSLWRMDRVVRLDLDSGTRCWFERKYVGTRVVYHRRLWGALGDADRQGGARVVSFDLDSPDIPWVCEPSPPPVVIGGNGG